MADTVVKDNTISNYIESYFLSDFFRTRKLHNDYWYIWAKSGLLDFVCEKLRRKYNIELLDYSQDYISGDVVAGDFDSVSIDSRQFYDSWERKEEFRKELSGIVHQLRLHRVAFDSLFEKIFYDIPIDVNEKWEGIDSEAIFHLTSPLPDEFQLLGFTSREIIKIKGEISRGLKTKLGQKKLAAKEEQVIDNWCSKLSRKTKPPKNKEEIYQAIEQLKHYKRTGSGIDASQRGIADMHQTSGVSASNIVLELPGGDISGKKYSDAWFRVLVKDLYQRFPLLHEFIDDYQKKLVT